MLHTGLESLYRRCARDRCDLIALAAPAWATPLAADARAGVRRRRVGLDAVFGRRRAGHRRWSAGSGRGCRRARRGISRGDQGGWACTPCRHGRDHPDRRGERDAGLQRRRRAGVARVADRRAPDRNAGDGAFAPGPIWRPGWCVPLRRHRERDLSGVGDERGEPSRSLSSTCLTDVASEVGRAQAGVREGASTGGPRARTPRQPVRVAGTSTRLRFHARLSRKVAAVRRV